jgi:MutS domain V
MTLDCSDNNARLPSLERRRARLERRAIRLDRISNRYWATRRVLFIVTGLLSFFLCKYSGQTAALVVAGLLVLVFGFVALKHRTVQDAIGRNSLMRDIKQAQLARIRLDWDHMPSPDQPLPDRTHPFEADLDITGVRSLHRLLDTAVTTEGSQRLRSWLTSTRPEPERIGKRQALVRELQTYSLFREQLQLQATLASEKHAGQARQWESKLVVAWLAHPTSNESLRGVVWLLGLLAALNLTLFVLYFLGLVPLLWPFVFVVYVAVMIARQDRITRAWGEVLELEKVLRRFRTVFRYLESRHYGRRPGLAEVCAPFREQRKRPSRELIRVGRMAAALGVRTNVLLWLIVNALLPWDFYFTHRLELLKEELGQLLPAWLDAWYELEAVNSLANFAYLNPDYVFPEIDTSFTGYQASGLGHPLLKREVKVCNDFQLLEPECKIAILTGSNMAGKSTFVRTVGINLCLAYAGAPVNAARLRVSPFRIFTCINVSDSVHDGISYFYAEVKRLRALLAAAEMVDDLPLLFLIDEIFRGTNNRERHLGGRAFLRTLASGRSSVGIISTHDLELVKLADEIGGLANLHFRDEIRAGRMIFDYHLHPGPCATTNALEIMRLEGLPTESF